ncbi:hypothetical protein MMC10_001717 [Thelotrema lepadinum]|nr:hypothetical protein [Thelotrema lepadinum]
MSSATILLGLTPVLLQSVGPTVNELGLMSMQRPGLATLLALGAAAVSPSRMFGYHEDWKLDEFLEVGSLLPQTLIDLLRENRSMQGLMCAIQYIVAAGSVANTFYTSYQLGVASVNNFDCTDSLMPLFWTLVPVVIHAFIALSFWRVMLPLKRRKEGERTLSSILKSSVTISIAQDAPPVRDLEADSFSSLIYWVISVIGWVHNVFGILVFSSLLFVEIADAVTILLRYFASTIFCQAVIRFEISSMRARYDAEPQHKESQSRSSSQEASKA